MDEEEWFVTNGEWRMGPLALDDLVEVLGREHVPGSMLVWKTGLENWVRPELVHELTTAAAARPPARAGLPGGPGVRVDAGAGGSVAGGATVSLAAPWFRVGTAKLLLMCVVTFGAYRDLLVLPAVAPRAAPRRAGASGAAHALLPGSSATRCSAACRRMRRSVASPARAVGDRLIAVAAASHRALAITVQLPDRCAVAPLSLLQLLPLALVQRAASAAALAAEPGADPNTRLTPINWIVIALGVMLLLLAVSLATPTQPAPAKPVPAETTQAARTSIDHAAQTIR